MAERAVDKASGTRASSGSGPCTPRSERDDAVGPLRITECDCRGITLRVAGEIDLNSHGDWEQALRRVTNQGNEGQLDLAELTFIDVRGVTLLVDIARGLSDGHRIVVNNAPPGLQRVLRVLWPDGVPAIVVKGEQ